MRYRFFYACALMAASFLVSCGTTSYHVKELEVTRIDVDPTWKDKMDPKAEALITPYRVKKDSIMKGVIGQAEVSMMRGRPECALGNLVADVLRSAAKVTLGKEADFAVMNIGGIRTDLSKGDITTENVFEILPFENALCVMTMKGSTLRELFENIAEGGGEAISGGTLVMSKSGKLLDAKVGGQPIDEERIYTVSSIDYLAEGNSGLTALTKALTQEMPADGVLRDVFMNYVKQMTAEGKALTSRIEGRVVLRED